MIYHEINLLNLMTKDSRKCLRIGSFTLIPTYTSFTLPLNIIIYTYIRMEETNNWIYVNDRFVFIFKHTPLSEISCCVCSHLMKNTFLVVTTSHLCTYSHRHLYYMLCWYARLARYIYLSPR